MSQIIVNENVGGIEGLYLIKPILHTDSRGNFMEAYNQREMEEAGIHALFVQDNQSMSTKGVLRGLHFQKKHPQAKLVRAIKGAIFDVAVDLRPTSKTFGKWHSELLTAENRRQLFIPRGFAHGFLTLTETAEIIYKCDDFWYPEDEGGIAWNDPDLGIDWPKLGGIKFNILERDLNWPCLKEIPTYSAY